MRLQEVRQLNVERSFDDSTAPLPTDLLAAAEVEPEKPLYISASDYADTVHVLRIKGFTWPEVMEWMVAHGAEFSQPAIIAGYRKRYRLPDGSLPA